ASATCAPPASSSSTISESRKRSGSPRGAALASAARSTSSASELAPYRIRLNDSARRLGTFDRSTPHATVLRIRRRILEHDVDGEVSGADEAPDREAAGVGPD